MYVYIIVICMYVCNVMQCNAMQCNAMQCNVMYVCMVCIFYMNGCVGNPKPNNIQILNILGLLHMTRPNWVLLPHAAFTTKVLKSSVL